MTGSIVNAPNLPWKGVIQLGALLRDRIGYAVAVANNADVRALGEHAYGLAKGMRDFVVVTMGTGLGSSIFSNGMIHKGTDGFVVSVPVETKDALRLMWPQEVSSPRPRS